MRRLLPRLVLGLIVAGGLALAAAGARAQGRPVPRTIIALYDGNIFSDLRYTPTHRGAEMPINHLGLVMSYYDVRRPLPVDAELSDVRGALVWFTGDFMPNPLEFIEWAHRFVDSGRKLVIFGGIGFARDTGGKPTPLEAVNGLLQRIGLRFDGRHIELTQDVRIVKRDRALLDFETPLPRQLPAYDRIVKVDAQTQAYLVVREGSDSSTDATLISTHPNGGFAALDYVHRGENLTPTRQQYLNLFEYFRRTFATDEVPKPDTTTLVGRRIYYSHIDGDGWRNQSQVKEYARRRALSAEVILREAVAPYPNLPVTVAPIVADLDPAWFGGAEAQAIAHEFFELPQVEIGSHTWSHPFDWEFFADNDATKEVPLLRRYPRRPRGNDDEAWAPVLRRAAARQAATAYDGKVLGSKGSYSVPRAYAVKPFDIELEIKGSIDFLNRLAPPGKRVALMQWSGNTLPWEEAIASTYGAGVLNLNGGDTRFDREQQSYSSVAPIGRKLKGGIQVYSSNANENVYTELWTSRFFGFSFLSQTWRNTEHPIRVKPKNLYYHMYSGEKAASLRALLGNLKEVEAEPIAPISASAFAEVALGFYSARIADLGDGRWQVADRGKLQTIRFDRAFDRKVDFGRSHGVLGQHHFQGSLYVSLDPAEPLPIVAIVPSERSDMAPLASRVYLIDSRWPIESLKLDGRSFAFLAHGFGPGEMTWKVEEAGFYRIVAEDGERTIESFAEAGVDGVLAFTLRTRPYAPAAVSVRRIPGA